MPGPQIVRRARKSLRERRMKQCLNDLTQNLDRVELKVHRHQKEKRVAKKKRKGIAEDPVPESIRKGVMTEDLYQIECDLHKAAGLPPPRRPVYLTDGYQPAVENTTTSTGRKVHLLGMVPFHKVILAVQRTCRRGAKKQ